MERIKSTKSAFNMARGFGRGIVTSFFLAVRMFFTGSTGKYKIKA